jgi:multimeric flavodoxin WrbA
MLHAFSIEDEFARQTVSNLHRILSEGGNDPTVINLTNRKIADCTGCFSCWTKTPGECVIKDDAPAITAIIARAERIVLVCPVVFGGFTSDLKRVLERSISILLPFMRVFHNEMHHSVRYGTPYQICGVGVLDIEDAEADASFRRRVQRLSLNFNGLHYCAGTVIRGNGHDAEQQRDLIEKPLNIGNEVSPAINKPPHHHSGQGPNRHVTSAVMVCGSPKGTKGSSWEIGSYLMRQLAAKGIATKSRTISPINTLIAEIQDADLLIFSFPLYADGIPARLKAVLKEIAAANVGEKYCAALVQCGFIESHQNDTAIEMCRLFARNAGCIWLGGLGRGGGGMLDGGPMEKAATPLVKTREALLVAADYLSMGLPIPLEAENVFRAVLLPRWIYAIAANLGFLTQSIRNGTVLSIWRTPY